MRLSGTSTMNKINPKKLLHSKWTAVSPKDNEKHFIVSDLEYDQDDFVIKCVIEAVLTNKKQEINWQDLKNSENWSHGWQK